MSEANIDLHNARILIVDDVPANIDLPRHALEKAGYQVMVATNGERALDIAARSLPDLVLLDIMMPDMNGYEVCKKLKQDGRMRDMPVLFLTALGEGPQVLEGFEAGGVDYVTKPYHIEEVLARVGFHLQRVRLAQTLKDRNLALELANEALEHANQSLKDEMARREAMTRERDNLAGQLSFVAQREDQRWGIAGFVGGSETVRGMIEQVGMLQQAPGTSVLVQGESGTGKELVARALHSGGVRAEGPFVPVNCSAIPGELTESLFFGHKKGAFTGADADRTGYFELADGGTLFLDEVGDMPLDLQPKLLRILEDGRYLPVGGKQEQTADVRVVAATNADLPAKIEQGLFRQDLYYRLARFTVQVPPLRGHKEDIPLLAQHFLTLFAQEMNLPTPRLSAAALARLDAYDFPGNVRELKNVIERALIESRGRLIGPEHLQLAQRSGAVATSGARIARDDIPLDLAAAEALVMDRALEECGGNVAAAARLLGIARSRIYRAQKRRQSRG